MDTLAVAVLSFFGFIVAYNTYGRWLARKVFRLDRRSEVPSIGLRDDKDFVPTRKEVVFGHHFTSIAGTGPIVGPAIAVFWGWLPALLWVLFGSILVGAVHDFGSLVVSLRNKGQTIGQAAGTMINPRARILFLIVLVFELTIILAVFGLVIGLIFASYPESVLSVWIEVPLAVGIGLLVHRKTGSLLLPSLVALTVMYVMIWVGTIVPIDISSLLGVPVLGTGVFWNAVVIWTLVLFVYCFIASVLPVWMLLQPRDFINSHELFLAMGLLVVGLGVASFAGQAHLAASAPAIAAAENVPADAPPMFPFLFITVACGAVSGFHGLVSSGTSSKQVASEPDAQLVGYGSMLLEGALAVIVILACCAGVGMGKFDRVTSSVTGTYDYVAAKTTQGRTITGREAWRQRYNPEVHIAGQTKAVGGWASHKLPQKLGAFIEGGANFLTSLGLPLKFAIGILAVLVASFAATTLDTATRLQRYVIQELSGVVGFKPLGNKYVATGVALAAAGAMAVFSGTKPGAGGMQLWPLFGAANQLLAGMVFLVIVFYLVRHKRPVWFAMGPLVIMIALPAWAMLWQMFNGHSGWWVQHKIMLFGFGLVIQGLTLWLVIESLLTWKKARAEGRALPDDE
ncbi:MAG: carbon starvation protein A [Planctomycetes bacterium]|nr:carbon starvation protein A [Planctomycetota bacterium]